MPPSTPRCRQVPEAVSPRSPGAVQDGQPTPSVLGCHYDWHDFLPRERPGARGAQRADGRGHDIRRLRLPLHRRFQRHRVRPPALGPHGRSQVVPDGLHAGFDHLRGGGHRGLRQPLPDAQDGADGAADGGERDLGAPSRPPQSRQDLPGGLRALQAPAAAAPRPRRAFEAHLPLLRARRRKKRLPRDRQECALREPGGGNGAGGGGDGQDAGGGVEGPEEGPGHTDQRGAERLRGRAAAGRRRRRQQAIPRRPRGQADAAPGVPQLCLEPEPLARGRQGGAGRHPGGAGLVHGAERGAVHGGGVRGHRQLLLHDGHPLHGRARRHRADVPDGARHRHLRDPAGPRHAWWRPVHGSRVRKVQAVRGEGGAPGGRVAPHRPLQRRGPRR
mmetsp:Transcript_67252/g.152097  ORF Transcript_67252/g.152097 Transcript_67252/m.152097 type:complete len:388 (+) Transcript_67252:588-1751(+)